MHTISDADFLRWAAEDGLVPDPQYPLSRQQLVFANCDCWGAWHVPPSPDERAKFVRTLIQLSGNAPLRIRLRGGGPFGSSTTDLDQERALSSAVFAAGIPIGIAGALEFEQCEIDVLHDLTLAFTSFGYRVETDLEIVPSDRHACLMLSHHGELVVHFSTPNHLFAFTKAMTVAGYPNDDDGDEDERR